MADGNDRTAVVLDRQPLWLEAVEAVLAATGVRTIWKTTKADEAVSLVSEHRPSLLVTEDAGHRGATSGLDVLRRVAADAPELRSIVLSDDHDAEAIQRAFDSGASAFIVKTAEAADFAAAVRQLFAHSVYLARTTAVAETVPAGDMPVTRREAEVLRLLAEGHSNAEIARRLHVTEQTVKFHLSNSYRKLGVTNRTQAARWAQLNLVDAPPPPAERGRTDAEQVYAA